MYNFLNKKKRQKSVFNYIGTFYQKLILYFGFYVIKKFRYLENCVFILCLDYNIGENETKMIQYSSYTLEKFADAMLSYSSGSPHKQMAKIHSFIVPEWEGFNFHTHGGIFNILKKTFVSIYLLLICLK